MNLLAVVFAQLLFFFGSPCPHGLLHIALGVLAADHESDLAARIGWNSGVRVLGNGKHLLTGLLKILNEGEMQPLVFGCA